MADSIADVNGLACSIAGCTVKQSVVVFRPGSERVVIGRHPCITIRQHRFTIKKFNRLTLAMQSRRITFRCACCCWRYHAAVTLTIIVAGLHIIVIVCTQAAVPELASGVQAKQ